MTDYMDKFPASLTTEQKHALAWRIEDDYKRSNAPLSASSKEDYIMLAIKFYTRNAQGMEDIAEQYRTYRYAQQKKSFVPATAKNDMGFAQRATA